MSWRRAAHLVLTTAAPAEKSRAALAAIEALGRDADDAVRLVPPAQPARPPRPLLAQPTDVPQRRLGTPEGRVALLHALAHIEFNAIDLAFDMALRFADEVADSGENSAEFVQDWIGVGAEEARHFSMVEQRLVELGSSYGALPAHGALWDAAASTGESVLARLAIAPMVLEARGLDVTPQMAERLRLAGDEESAVILDRIFEEEIGHVAAGVRWFERLCAARNLDTALTFRRLVDERFRGRIKPPFNRPARKAAGMAEALYADWNGVCGADA